MSRFLPHERTRAWVLVGLIALVWGIHWSILKVALEDVPPFTYAALRVLIALVALAAWLGATGKLRPPARTGLPIVVSYGLLAIAAAIAFMNLGLPRIGAGHASILAYTLPLWVVPMMAAARRSLPTRAEWLGLVLGLVGLALLLQPGTIDWGASGAVTGALLLLLGAVAGAAAMVHVRLHRWSGTPLTLQPWQLLVALVPLGVLAIPEAGAITWSPTVILALLYSGLVATALGYWASQTVVRTLGPMAAGIGSLAVPVVGVAGGAILLGELVTAAEALGLLVTMAAVLVVLRGGRTEGGSARRPDPDRHPSPRLEAS